MNTSNSGKAPEENKLKTTSKTTSKTRYSINFSVDQNQFERLKREYKEGGRPSMSSFIREGMGLERKSPRINPVDLVQRLDAIGEKIGRITDSIDRVARYADGLAQREGVDCQAIHQFNLLMNEYVAERRELVKAYRAVVRMV